MQLGKRALGIAFGLVWGFAIMFGTWYFSLLGAPEDMFTKVSAIYIGFSISFVGGIIGLIYGFVTGFIGGFLIAWIYNLVNNSLTKSKTT